MLATMETSKEVMAKHTKKFRVSDHFIGKGRQVPSSMPKHEHVQAEVLEALKGGGHLGSRITDPDYTLYPKMDRVPRAVWLALYNLKLICTDVERQRRPENAGRQIYVYDPNCG